MHPSSGASQYIRLIALQGRFTSRRPPSADPHWHLAPDLHHTQTRWGGGKEGRNAEAKQGGEIRVQVWVDATRTQDAKTAGPGVSSFSFSADCALEQHTKRETVRRHNNTRKRLTPARFRFRGEDLAPVDARKRLEMVWMHVFGERLKGEVLEHDDEQSLELHHCQRPTFTLQEGDREGEKESKCQRCGAVIVVSLQIGAKDQADGSGRGGHRSRLDCSSSDLYIAVDLLSRTP